MARLIPCAAFVLALLTAPPAVCAQEAALSGTVTDATGGVLPGVTITATHEATGNTFVAVSDSVGAFRIPLRAGQYKVTIALPGFTTITRSGLEILVGQQAVVNLQMAPSTVQESVTVTGEAPLIDVSKSRMGGNIDPRQLSELPVNGRNWMQLTLLAPGSRQNAATEPPASGNGSNYQINVDGQQVTQIISAVFGQAKFSQDAIAEFQFVSSRFDATQGRSSGIQINAITKSGTNTSAGSFSSYFRDDKFNAADFIQNKVLPYSDEQLSTTFGGPIRRDRVHVFANYEYERQPQTFYYTTPYPEFNVSLPGTTTDHKGGVRVDVQFSARTHLTFRWARYHNNTPCEPNRCGGSNVMPSSAIEGTRDSNDLNFALSQVLGTRAVNEIKGGYAGFNWWQRSLIRWDGSPLANMGFKGGPSISLRGFTAGQTHVNSPQHVSQGPYSIRDDFSVSFVAHGRHDVKIGGEYIDARKWIFICARCLGILDAQGGAAPANLASLFPDPLNVRTWRLAELTPIVRTFTQAIGTFDEKMPRHVGAAWIQDDWSMTRRLTLNLGLRYDIAKGVFSEDISLPPFLSAGRPIDKNNLGPRLGFAYSLNDKTVVRGGYGVYFSEVTDQEATFNNVSLTSVGVQLLPDGRPDFAANPYNGPAPTFAQAQAAGFKQSYSGISGPLNKIPYGHQSSIGVQRQLTDSMALEADYVYTGSRAQLASRNVNLAFNTATGTNYPFNDLTHLPYPTFGIVTEEYNLSESNYHALQTALKKRFTDNWQASVTYTRSGQWDRDPLPISPGCQYPTTINPAGAFVCNQPITLATDLAGDYYLNTDQRNRLVFNGIWSIPYGLQLSGLYFFGDNGFLTPSSGVDVRQQGTSATPGSNGRLRADGTLITRSGFNKPSIHRVDLRIKKHIKITGRGGIDGILDTFNVFNHANFSNWTVNESTPTTFGKPQQDSNIAYQPRMLQLGLRVTF
jgi:carboxypeptidase family protein/TonB-dependent receptor-like protein